MVEQFVDKGRYVGNADKAVSIQIDKLIVFNIFQIEEHVDEIRKKAGMDMIPMLIIYRIDKDSKVFGKHDKDTRADLGMPCDIIGIQICVPGDQINMNFRKSLTIRLPEKDKEDEVEENA